MRSSIFSSTKQKIYLFTNINNCKSCNNPILNLLNYHSPVLDSLGIEYELFLKCRRNSDLNYYKKYFNLDSNLKIFKLNDSIANQFKIKNNSNFMIYERNDSIICESEYMDVILECLSRNNK